MYSIIIFLQYLECTNNPKLLELRYFFKLLSSC